MPTTILDRREFMRRALSATAVVATAATGAVAITASNGAWAMSLKSLDARTAAGLLRMSRLLYPHDALGDVYYAASVEALDKKAAADPKLAAQLAEGVAGLDRALGVPFLQLSEGTQVEVLTGLETTGFFQTVRGHTVVALYNNPLVWPHFGYQGASYEQGGYLLRGFQDAGWTGDPSPDASPAPHLG
jgi:hypothetical protein